MLTTKRYDYVPFDHIHVHPCIANHRPLNAQKVRHYAEDIAKNGLLEPLIVWERKPGEYFLVGGFHRLGAIRVIREKNPGHFDRVDVRVVDGDLEEMRALNLKLNADRLDARPSDYFDVVIYLNNANWPKERIAEFLDKSVSWIDEIVRHVPGMDSSLRRMLDEGKVTWNRARAICREVTEAEPGTEKQVLDTLLREASGVSAISRPRRAITLKSAARRLTKHVEKSPKTQYTVSAADLLSLLLVLQGNGCGEEHHKRVRKAFPALVAQA